MANRKTSKVERKRKERIPMVLQHMLWTKKANTKIAELYYHTKASVKSSKQGIKISAGGFVQFDTYFNIFLAEKWKQYTRIKEVVVRVIIDGVGTLALMGSRDRKEKSILLKEKTFCGKQEISFFVPLSNISYFYLTVKAEQETLLESGTIESARIEKNKKAVKMALVICTYNRPKEVIKNIQQIKSWNKKEKELLFDQIYIIDNGRNLKQKEIEGEQVILISNKNTGGSGGFSRGMWEAMKQEELTHVVLMDDDVLVKSETFYRTKAVLSFIKSEYQENFLGGAMFRRDKPYILHAAGEDWADGWIANPYKFTDIRKLEQVLTIAKSVETKQAYAGWWYCCIPKSHIVKNGYPMPFFLHCDDVEYALRSGKPPIYFNGIAVWHEEFENKRGSILEYYNVRNRLITNAIYKDQNRLLDAIYILCERFYATVFRYRYKDFTLSVKAVQDFLKGPKWLQQVDAEQLHQTLQRYGYQMKEVEELPEKEKQRKSVKRQVITIGRYCFPAFGRKVIRIGAPISAYTGKKKLLLVDPKIKKGFEVKKSWRETFQCIRQFEQIFWKLILQYKKSEQLWRKERK